MRCRLTDLLPRPRTTPVDRGDALTWQTVEVDGRTTWYGSGGTGAPVLFLHGWGLGSRAYKRVLRRLTARGWRCYAPAMPGFGGTADLQDADFDIAAYARWVDRFLDAVAVDEPVLVIGHSFGGGVGIRLAYDRPDRVGYLVLANAVGGGSWLGGRSLSDRPIWDWAMSFGMELFPLSEGLGMLQAMSEDLFRNLTGNPIAMARAAGLARTADLTPELVELGRRQTPVLALTSAADGVIPDTAFDALCDALGTEGRVVAGAHSWLLTAPDAFAEVLDNIEGIQRAEVPPAPLSPSREVAGLLAWTGVPDDVADRLLAQASPMWLQSETPETLAGDLALCHPALAPGEVRAVARPLAGSSHVRLTVVAHDRRGLLADTAGALAAEGLPVTGASAVTWTAEGLAMHAVTFDAADLDPAQWASIGTRLQGGAVAPPVAMPDVTVTVNGAAMGRAVVEVVAADQLGVLATLCRWFADNRVTIECAAVRTDHGNAHDTFLVEGEVDPVRMTAELTAAAELAAV